MNSLKTITTLTLLALTLFSLNLSAQTKGARKTETAPAKPTPTPANDIKIRTRSAIEGGSGFESAVYIKGARERNEMGGGAGFVNISQCDLKRTIQINDPMRTYLIQPWNTDEAEAPKTETTKDENRDERKPEPARRGGVITMTRTMTDTGERKDFFGYTARHIKTSMITESSPDACNQTKSKMETDGWYIDLSYGLECSDKNTGGYAPVRNAVTCRDRMQVKNIGAARLGYPVDVTTTIYDEQGRRTVMRTEVVELTRATLDAALFDVPAGYTEARDYQQLVGVNPQQMMAQALKNEDKTADHSSVSAALKNNQTAAPQIALGPKKAGVIRVGVVTPKTQMGQGNAGEGFAEPIRNLLMKNLSGSAVEVASLEARLPAQIEAEAKQKECDFILYTSVTQKQGGGGFGGLLKKAGSLSNVASMGGYGSTTGAATGTAAGTMTVADISSTIKAKDEITLEYKVTPAGAASPVAASTLKSKAKSDGEDILSPLIEQTATATLNAVTKR
jgi:hypothetical protein